MNKTITSKAELLSTAKDIVFHEGIEQLNIRYLAQKSGVSVGSVYNYFSSKSDLILAVMEEFWKILFHGNICTIPEYSSFPDFFEEVYHKLYDILSDFKSIFLQRMDNLNLSDTDKAQCMMKQYLEHIHQGLLKVLEEDTMIPENIWCEQFTKTQFISFVTSTMMNMLSQGEIDSSYFAEIIRRILYPNQ